MAAQAFDPDEVEEIEKCSVCYNNINLPDSLHYITLLLCTKWRDRLPGTGLPQGIYADSNRSVQTVLPFDLN